MKKNIITAAFAAASALLLVSSCAKEELRENVNTEDGKVFTAVINQDLTKTTITSEYKVNWVEGDQIDINGSIFSATPDASDATKATFTKVSGSDPDGTFGYTAVYPASIMVATQATLPATQTYAAGKFNAPMCAMSSTENLEFKNFCGVLCFALKGTDKVKSIAVTANEQLCGPFEFAAATSFSFNGENVGYTVTLNCGEGVQLDASTATNFYVYLPPFDSYTAGMKITVTNTDGETFEKTTTKSVEIVRNMIYTFNWTASFSPAEPDCVEIGGVKWATKNLGAEKVTDYGDYFAWGETAPYYEGTGGWPTTPTWKSGQESGYAWQSYCGSSDFSEWSTSPYNATTKILKPEFDAASQILGNGWRMPTSAEFKALYDACLNGSYDTSTNPSGASASVGKGVYWCTNYDGVAGCLFCDGTNKLFFPAVGYGGGTSLSYAGSSGGYWSSLYSDNTGQAYIMYFSSYYVYPQFSFHRCTGFSIRPVKDAAPTTTGTAKRTGNIDVNWVQLWAGGPKFAEYNVGNSNAEDYGGYYTWGGTYKNGQSITWSDDHNTGDNVLSGDNDTATNLWGSNWRMPTQAELEALLNSTNCDVAWTDSYNGTGIKGRIYTGKGAYASNSVFLPAAGNCSDGSVGSQGSKGFYRSSTPYDSNKAYSLYFASSSQKVYYYSRITGYSVRAVLAE